MSEAKHTPGPWRTERRDWLGNDAGHKVYVTGGHFVEWGDDDEELEVCVGVAIVEGNATSQGVTEANARLIAAAPEMYSILRRLEWSHGDICPCCAGDIDAGHRVTCDLAALLRRVEGEG